MNESQIPGWSGESEEGDASWPDSIAQKRLKQLVAFFAVLFLVLIIRVIQVYG